MRKKKVVLFFPPPFPSTRYWQGTPLALLAISRLLDKEGYEVQIISDFLQDNYLKETLRECQDSLCLGISSMTGYQILNGLKAAKLVRKNLPKLPIVWGGWHPSVLPEETLRDENVDIVVRGPGDRAFPEIVHAIEDKGDLAKIPGIAYKNDGKIFLTPPRPFEDINNFPPLPYHLVDIEKCVSGTEFGKRTIQYISSYGCPHRCGFCVEEIVNKRAWKGLAAERVVEEWEFLVKKYQVDSIASYDTNFFVDKKRVYDICRGLLKKNIKIKWGNVNGRVPHLARFEPEIWEVMERSGCSMILTGAESGWQEALDFITKDAKVDQTYVFAKLCEKYHIKVLYSLLAGLPWSPNLSENEKKINRELKATLKMVDKIFKIGNNNRFMFCLYIPYPGSRLFHKALELGLKVPKNLAGWSTFLQIPEDTFEMVINQRWIERKQAELIIMLDQYIFGLLDKDTFQVLKERIQNKFWQVVFALSFKVGYLLVWLRWQFKFFGLPLDYWVFSQVKKYSKLV